MITLTERAAEEVKKLMVQHDRQGYGLRVYIAGGGCSGFKYGMQLDEGPDKQDLVLESHGVPVYVAPGDTRYLQGTEVDWVDGGDLANSGFKIDNPNAVSTCGCGQSFNTSDNAGSATASSCA
jgi:iron-sulfur cluster assembly accessory protein